MGVKIPSTLLCFVMLLIVSIVILPESTFGEGESFTYNFVEGWGIITLPLDVENNSIEALFGDLIAGGKIDEHFFGYDQYNQTNTFAEYLIPGYAYRMFVYSDTDCTIEGTTITDDLSIDMEVGYNHIGWVHSFATTAMQLCYYIPGCEAVYTYSDPEANYIEYFYGSDENNFAITRGMGLMVWCNTSSVWDGSALSSLPPYLTIQSKDQFNESTLIKVTVESDGSPVEGVKIEFDGDTYYTTLDGTVDFPAPSVDTNTLFTISASKIGYVYDSKSITVINMDPAPDPVLEVSTLPTVQEGQSFQVNVLSNGISIENVLVGFNGNSYYTDSNGVVTITASIVEANTVFIITASKTGYQSDQTTITVYDELTVEPLIEILAPVSVNEGENFQIVVSADDNFLEDANILFAGASFMSDGMGSVTFDAPLVDITTNYDIDVSKMGYISNRATVSVIDVPSEMPNIQLVSPNGGETLLDSYNVRWNVENLDTNDYGVTIQYKYSDGLWNAIVENLEPTLGQYSWDTNTVENGYPYQVKIILNQDTNSDGVYETYVDSDISDGLFTVENLELTTYGWLYGMVYESIGDVSVPVKEAMVCVITSQKNNVITSKCILTDKNGQYTLSIPKGTYSIRASKTGYNLSLSSNVKVEANKGIDLNFALHKMATRTGQTLADYTIENEKKSGKIAAEINIEEDETQIDILNEDVNVEITSMEQDEGDEKITVTVSASGEEDGTKIVVYLGQTDDKQIKIEYDGETLSEATDIISFFSEDNENESYAIFSSGGEKIAVINIPYFSEHEISIFLISPAQAMQYTTYVIIVSIMIIVLAGLFMFRKGKEEL